jgi:hypothetical protein
MINPDPQIDARNDGFAPPSETMPKPCCFQPCRNHPKPQRNRAETTRNHAPKPCTETTETSAYRARFVVSLWSHVGDQEQLIRELHPLASSIAADPRSPRQPCQATRPQAPAALARSPATHGRLARSRTSDSRKTSAGASGVRACAVLGPILGPRRSVAGSLPTPSPQIQGLVSPRLPTWQRFGNSPTTFSRARPEGQSQNQGSPAHAAARPRASNGRRGSRDGCAVHGKSRPRRGVRVGGGGRKRSPRRAYLASLFRGPFFRIRPTTKQNEWPLKFWAAPFPKI